MDIHERFMAITTVTERMMEKKIEAEKVRAASYEYEKALTESCKLQIKLAEQYAEKLEVFTNDYPF